MTENNKNRNGIVTTCLWLGILGYLTITVLYFVAMYSENSSNTVLGLGLCSMLMLADALGVLLMMRWSKNGFYLLIMSAILSSVVYFSVLKFDLLSSLVFLMASAVWFVVLQFKSGGKSVWSQLKSSWDSKHCRHIYQMVAVIEVIIFVLTLIAFGRCQEDKKISTLKIVESSKIEPKPSNLVPTKNVDSIKEPTIKSPLEKRSATQKPVKPEKTNDKKSETSSNQQDKQGISNKTFGLYGALKYLDTHKIWNAEEMKQYPDLKDLNRRIIASLHIGHSVIPHNISHKSKKLRQIERLLLEYEHIQIKKSSKISIKCDPYMLSPDMVIRSLESAIARKKKERENESYEKVVSDEAKNAEPSFGLR